MASMENEDTLSAEVRAAVDNTRRNFACKSSNRDFERSEAKRGRARDAPVEKGDNRRQGDPELPASGGRFAHCRAALATRDTPGLANRRRYQLKRSARHVLVEPVPRHCRRR